MGVTGLWQIVQPCARPIKIEALNRKRLAVDASIWIYQFLKAVRDKEGNALRNSHVVGFFRRICKLLYFGIKPVFVFDGGAPALKRQTVLGRQRRREGRRDDAARTAGKLLAVQMQRIGEEEMERRKRQVEIRGQVVEDEAEEQLPAEGELVYAEEIGMSAQERAKSRKFTKKDAYHLPELPSSIEGMGQPNDPRVMSTEELEEYARQFNSGQDINLYDFSKIDFDSEFFRSLPMSDRYNILNAARLRSRLRMGYSKEQLEDMFPDRMAFSKFQIERTMERNQLTQRLMNLNGMNESEYTFGINGTGRIAGDNRREYVLVKNDGVEGGWALGVVSTDKEVGQRNRPIDLEARIKMAAVEEESDEEVFEDVPIEGLNRLPVQEQASYAAQEAADARRRLAEREVSEDPDSMFVAETKPYSHPNLQTMDSLFGEHGEEEDEHLARAIAMSLEKQNRRQSEADSDEIDFEDVLMPEYEQKRVEDPKPLVRASGKMVAHMVNNRANASVPKRRRKSESSDDDMDLRAALAASKKQKRTDDKSGQGSNQGFAHVHENVKNPFDGPLPFEKLSLPSSFGKKPQGSVFGQKPKTSIFGKKAEAAQTSSKAAEKTVSNVDEEMGGGFELEPEESEDTPKALPPWLAGTGDIRTDVVAQRENDRALNAADRERALEEKRIFQRDHGIIRIDSSDDEDVEVVSHKKKVIDLTEPIVDTSKRPSAEVETAGDLAEIARAEPPISNIPQNIHSEDKVGSPEDSDEPVEWSDSDHEQPVLKQSVVEPAGGRLQPASKSKSPSPVFEDVEMSTAAGVSESIGDDVEKEKSASPVFEDAIIPNAARKEKSASPVFEDAIIPDTAAKANSASAAFEDAIMPDVAANSVSEQPQTETLAEDDLFNETLFNGQQGATNGDDEFGDSDLEDEELLAQLAIEAEEHARFASELNNKTPAENAAAYEAELKSLRNQQKKDRRDADEVTHAMITECQSLLSLFGLPYITAPMEAEAQCAELVNLGLVDGIVTDDSDIFLFGGTRVYKNMFNSNKFVECYLSSDLDKELSLSRDALIRIAHLLGSDYTEGLPGVGPVTALEIISEFASPDGLKEFKEWWNEIQINGPKSTADLSTSFRKKFKRSQAKKLFLPTNFPSSAVTEAYMKPEVDHSPEVFQWGVPDLDNLRKFLMATIGWTQERTDEILVPVIKDMNRRETEGTQSNITRYFEGTVGLGAAGTVRAATGSKRMREAVGKLKKKNKGTLHGTFGDEAAEWARKDDEVQRKAAEKEKGVKKRGRGKGKKKVVENEDENGDEEVAEGNEAEDGGEEDGDDESEENGRKSRSKKGKGVGKGKAKGTRARKEKASA